MTTPPEEELPAQLPTLKAIASAFAAFYPKPHHLLRLFRPHLAHDPVMQPVLPSFSRRTFLGTAVAAGVALSSESLLAAETPARKIKPAAWKI